MGALASVMGALAYITVSVATSGPCPTCGVEVTMPEKITSKSVARMANHSTASTGTHRVSPNLRPTSFASNWPPSRRVRNARNSEKSSSVMRKSRAQKGAAIVRGKLKAQSRPDQEWRLSVLQQDLSKPDGPYEKQASGLRCDGNDPLRIPSLPPYRYQEPGLRGATSSLASAASSRSSKLMASSWCIAKGRGTWSSRCRRDMDSRCVQIPAKGAKK